MLAITLIAALVAPGASAPAPTEDELILRHVNVVDVATGATRPGQRIRITDGRIVAISQEDDSEPRAATVVDARGQWAIPGLWDMHAHLTFQPGLQPGDAADATLPLYVANGILGVRDMGSPRLEDLLRLRDEIASGRRVGPRLVVTGRQLDGAAATDWTKQRVVTAADARRAVRELQAAGADFVKVYDRIPREAYRAVADECRRRGMPMAGHLPLVVTPFEAAAAGQRSIEHLGPSLLREACHGYLAEGASPPADPDPARTAGLLREMRAALSGAVRVGSWSPPTLAWLRSPLGRGTLATLDRELGGLRALDFLRETRSGEGAEMAVLARHAGGSRTHRFRFGPDGGVHWLADEPDVFHPGRARELAGTLRAHGVWVTPTLAPLRAIAMRRELLADPDPRLQYVHAEVRRQLDPRNDPRYATWAESDWQWMRRSWRRDAELTRFLHEAGVRILAGTDAVTDHCLPGFGLHDELALLVEAGLTPLEALRAATLEPAAYLGRSHELGALEPGRLADLVLLAADPLADIRNTTAIRGVVQAGRWLDRAALDELLAGVKRVVDDR